MFDGPSERLRLSMHKEIGDLTTTEDTALAQVATRRRTSTKRKILDLINVIASILYQRLQPMTERN